VDETKSRKIKWRKITAIFMASAAVVGLAVATQDFAAKVDYHVSLGWNVRHFYFPLMILWWAVKWRNDAELWDALGDSAGWAMAIFAVAMMVFWFIHRFAEQKAIGAKDLHGSAHWASPDELKATGLLHNKSGGVYVGSWIDERGKTQYLRDSGPSHVLCFAPTRSGKGVGLVLPTLLAWEQSCLIADLKGELWELTAGWRRNYAHNKVLRLEPGNPHGSARWNPLNEVRIFTEYEVSDCADLARIIVDRDGKGLTDHWARTAYDLLTGCIAYKILERERWRRVVGEMEKEKADYLGMLPARRIVGRALPVWLLDD
jgi:type IV secretion system protein VirD4